MKKIYTLCIVHQHPKILLGMKKRGFGEGRWNGFGGKVKEGETIDEAAKREVLEEAQITVKDLDKRGIIEFEFKGKPEILEVHIYKIKEYNGNPLETEEMKPKWFHINEIPFEEMWPDDKYWMPLFLNEKKFVGKIFFEDINTIISTDLKEVDDI